MVIAIIAMGLATLSVLFAFILLFKATADSYEELTAYRIESVFFLLLGIFIILLFNLYRSFLPII